MKYIEINIDTTVNGLEPIIGELLSIGITDTVIEDPRDIDELMKKKNEYDWDYLDDSVAEKMKNSPKVSIYLEDTDENRAKTQEIKKMMSELSDAALNGEYGEAADFGSLTVHIAIDDDALWKDKWKEYFKPSKISENIVVKPTWENYKREEGEIILEIDPGMAFGTGTHETTSMCIRSLEKYMKKGDRVLDVGCGSGIISIAAALTGCSDVLGIDIDPIAVEVSKDNIKLNRVEKIAKVQYGDLTKGVDYSADVIVANLMADLIIMLSEDIAKHMKGNGYFISSGILVEKEKTVSDHLMKKGFKIIEIMREGDWCCIVATKIKEKLYE